LPEISAEFSAPPEFSGDVLEKDLSTGWARTSDLQITKPDTLPLRHCILMKSFYGIYYETFRPFLYLLAAGFSGSICFYWPGFSGHICS
jgi:hypothetical protein